MATLQAIEQSPGKRAADLMEPLGWTELHDFKMHVRKLKELGLTLSLRVGYRLAPRGEAFLRHELQLGRA
jgi:flavin-binding protein dodecin